MVGLLLLLLLYTSIYRYSSVLTDGWFVGDLCRRPLLVQESAWPLPRGPFTRRLSFPVPDVTTYVLILPTSTIAYE